MSDPLNVLADCPDYLELQQLETQWASLNEQYFKLSMLGEHLEQGKVSRAVMQAIVEIDPTCLDQEYYPINSFSLESSATNYDIAMAGWGRAMSNIMRMVGDLPVKIAVVLFGLIIFLLSRVFKRSTDTGKSKSSGGGGGSSSSSANDSSGSSGGSSDSRGSNAGSGSNDGAGDPTPTPTPTPTPEPNEPDNQVPDGPLAKISDPKAGRRPPSGIVTTKNKRKEKTEEMLMGRMENVRKMIAYYNGNIPVTAYHKIKDVLDGLMSAGASGKSWGRSRSLFNGMVNGNVSTEELLLAMQALTDNLERTLIALQKIKTVYFDAPRDETIGMEECLESMFNEILASRGGRADGKVLKHTNFNDFYRSLDDWESEVTGKREKGFKALPVEFFGDHKQMITNYPPSHPFTTNSTIMLSGTAAPRFLDQIGVGFENNDALGVAYDKLDKIQQGAQKENCGDQHRAGRTKLSYREYIGELGKLMYELVPNTQRNSRATFFYGEANTGVYGGLYFGRNYLTGREAANLHDLREAAKETKLDVQQISHFNNMKGSLTYAPKNVRENDAWLRAYETALKTGDPQSWRVFSMFAPEDQRTINAFLKDAADSKKKLEELAKGGFIKVDENGRVVPLRPNDPNYRHAVATSPGKSARNRNASYGSAIAVFDGANGRPVINRAGVINSVSIRSYMEFMNLIINDIVYGPIKDIADAMSGSLIGARALYQYLESNGIKTD